MSHAISSTPDKPVRSSGIQNLLDPRENRAGGIETKIIQVYRKTYVHVYTSDRRAKESKNTEEEEEETNTLWDLMIPCFGIEE